MSGSPDVSIVVPAFEASETLPTTLDSLLAQTGDASFEVIVVDDGSTDETASVMADYARRDDRIRAVPSTGNAGVAAARERGLSLVRGEFVWFVDADDTVEPDGLSRLFVHARRTDADVVVGTATAVGGRTARTATDVRVWRGSESFRALLLGEIRGQLWDKLIAARILVAVDVPRTAVHSDVALLARILARADHVRRVDVPVYRYRIRGDSIIGSSRRRAESLRIVDAVVTDAAQRLGSVPRSELAFYRAKYIGLSMMRDSAAGGWTRRQAADLRTEGRRRIVVSAVALALRRGDLRSAATLLLARCSPWAFLAARRVGRVQRQRVGRSTTTTPPPGR